MSSELHYLDIILKMEKFTLMSSEFGENCLYFCDFARIFVSLSVFLLFSHGQSVSEQLQLLIYEFLSSKCCELHLRVF